MMIESRLDKLSNTLFGGEVVAGDVMLVEGSSGCVLSLEKSSEILFSSMVRMGIIEDGKLVFGSEKLS